METRVVFEKIRKVFNEEQGVYCLGIKLGPRCGKMTIKEVMDFWCYMYLRLIGVCGVHEELDLLEDEGDKE